MKILIVYDSIFGNTKQIADMINSSLGSQEDIKTSRVSDVHSGQLDGPDLLIVGSPTRAFRPTKEIAGFLNTIPPDGLKGIRVAAFDTRLSPVDVNSRVLNIMVRLFGYAAKPIADKLEKKGGILIAPPEGFLVKGSEGPLKEGELERAAAWAGSIMKAQKIYEE
jgi:flavodoxin